MNDPYLNKPIGQVPWLTTRDMNNSNAQIVQPPKIDKEVSNIVGKEIRVNDPRLIKAVNKMRIERQKKGGDRSTEPDNLYSDRKFKEALKEEFR